MGIELTFNAPFCPPSESKAPPKREGGILFITPFNQNEEMLRKWFKRTLIKPSETILINHLLLPPQKRPQESNRAN